MAYEIVLFTQGSIGGPPRAHFVQRSDKFDQGVISVAPGVKGSAV